MQSITSNPVAPVQHFGTSAILHEFFDKYDLHECQREIWNLVIAYFSQPTGNLPDAITRSNTAFFCSNINVLLHQLHDAWKSGTAQVASD